jgi:hypothetical protein
MSSIRCGRLALMGLGGERGQDTGSSDETCLTRRTTTLV